MSTIKHLIFDLDDTLLDTTGLLIPLKDTPNFLSRISEPLPLMPGAWENLQYLKSKYRLYLLTQGQKELQKIKIKSLGIESLFHSIDIMDPHLNQTKRQYFESFTERFGALAQEVMSIGNRRSTDIGPAKEMGFVTCWFAYGEHQDEEIKNPNEKTNFNEI